MLKDTPLNKMGPCCLELTGRRKQLRPLQRTQASIMVPGGESPTDLSPLGRQLWQRRMSMAHPRMILKMLRGKRHLLVGASPSLVLEAMGLGRDLKAESCTPGRLSSLPPPRLQVPENQVWLPKWAHLHLIGAQIAAATNHGNERLY